MKTQTVLVMMAALAAVTLGQQKLFQQQWENPCNNKKLKTTAHPEFCDRYLACQSGVPVELHCPNGLVYVGQGLSGPFDSVCDYSFKVDCGGREKRSVHAQQQRAAQEDPCKLKSRVVGDITYCDRYWECVSGQPELYDCPNGLVFAGKHRGVTEGCDYPWRSNYCDGKQLANPPISTEHCDWLYGIFGHETSCTRYWTCWNGTATEQLCIGGLLYNEEKHSCDWPENVEGCQKHPLCNEDANGNVPLGKSCNRYWQCQGGYPRLQRCPAMLVFDRRSLRCVVPPTEDCEVPTTQAPLPDELEGDGVQNIPGPRPDNQQGPVPIPLRNRPRN